MTGTPGEALDTDEAVRAISRAFREADVTADVSAGGFWFQIISALNAQGVTLVWDPPKPTTDALAAVVEASKRCEATKVGIHYADGPLHDLAVAVRRMLDGSVPTEGDR